MSVSKAIEQMQRGMASEAGRLEVNAETEAARQQRAQELEARRAASTPATPQASRLTFGDRMQRGDF